MKNFQYLSSVLALGILIISCGIDEKLQEATRLKIKQLQSEAEINKQQIEESTEKINNEEIIEKSLIEENKYLDQQLKENKEEVFKVLKEIYDDSRNKTTYIATCRSCHKQVSISYARFYHLAHKYNTGWTEWQSYKWFLWWEWGHQTESFEFHECPQCTIEKGAAYFERKVRETTDKISQVVAKLIEERRKLQENQKMFQERSSSASLFENNLERNLQLIAEKKKEENEKLEAQKKAAEKELENEKLKREKEEEQKEKEDLKKKIIEQNLNTARIMLKGGIPIIMIMEATGLTKEEIERI